MEGFRAPAKVASAAGRRLKVYLDTAYERATNDFFENAIRPALLASRHLVIVATPDAVASRGAADWVEREVAEFLAGPNAGNVVAVRGAGAFDDPLPARLKERFPNIEILDLRGASLLWFLNPLVAHRLAAEKIKLVAPLLGVAPDEMPLLRQEEERRQELRLGVTAGGTAGVLVAVSALSIYAIQNQWRAERALESSLFATGRTVMTVAGSLPREGDYRELRSQILNQACDVIDTLAAEGLGEARIGERAACMVERAREHARQNEAAAARRLLNEAVAAARAAFAPARDQDAFYALVDGQEALAEFLEGRKALAGAESVYQALLRDIAAMIAKNPRDERFHAIEGRALWGLTGLLNTKGEKTRVAPACERAAAAYARAEDLAQGGGDTSYVAELNARRGETLLACAGAHFANGARGQERDALERLIKVRARAWREENIDTLIEAARAYAFLGDVLVALGEAAKAAPMFAEAGAKIARARVAGALTAAQADELAKLAQSVASATAQGSASPQPTSAATGP